MEENKEGDTTTGQATHRITRGIHDKVCYLIDLRNNNAPLFYAVTNVKC